MKRIISLLAALVLVFSTAVPAFAAETAAGAELQGAVDEILTEFGGVVDEIADAINGADGDASVSAQYAYTSDPVGTDDGSVIEFTQANYVVDNADLFSDDEETVLFEKISAIRTNYKFDAVILTTHSTEGKETVDYTDDYFDYNGYGYGSERNGIIIMLCISEDGSSRNIHISGRGSIGTGVFNSYALDFNDGPIFREVKPILSEGRYYDAEIKLLEIADERLNWYYEDKENGGSGDYNDGYNGGNSADVIIKRELIAVAVGMAVAFVVVFVLKRKMKTNRIQTSAANYEKPGSMKVTSANDYFIRKQVTRTAIPKHEDSGSSGDHTSSSGASHSGGGGSF